MVVYRKGADPDALDRAAGQLDTFAGECRATRSAVDQAVEVAPGDHRLAVEPDVRVEPTAADVLAGRDPVLARAVALP